MLLSGLPRIGRSSFLMGARRTGLAGKGGNLRQSPVLWVIVAEPWIPLGGGTLYPTLQYSTALRIVSASPK